MNTVNIEFEPTPNPQSMRFSFNQQISNTHIEYSSSEEALHSPLASKLFGFPWVDAVYIGKDFVTVTKQDWVEWQILCDPLSGLLKEHIERGEAVILDVSKATDIDSNDSEEVKQIKQILDKEIRPQVALDGGDILFQAYEDQIVKLKMIGACNGCPSSGQTLKMGVEARLKQSLPEIKEVIAVD